MIKLNKTTEYSLMALSYIRWKNEYVQNTISSNARASAREIAEHFKLPFEILAKTLQRLKEKGIISSTQGTRGGYLLARNLSELSLAEFLDILEGPVEVVSCTNNVGCEYNAHCSIKGIMNNLNSKVYSFLKQISVEELTRQPHTEVML